MLLFFIVLVWEESSLINLLFELIWRDFLSPFKDLFDLIEETPPKSERGGCGVTKIDSLFDAIDDIDDTFFIF